RRESGALRFAHAGAVLQLDRLPKRPRELRLELSRARLERLRSLGHRRGGERLVERSANGGEPAAKGCALPPFLRELPRRARCRLGQRGELAASSLQAPAELDELAAEPIRPGGLVPHPRFGGLLAFEALAELVLELADLRQP